MPNTYFELKCLYHKDFKTGKELKEALDQVSIFKFASLYSWVRLSNKSEDKHFCWTQKVKEEYRLVIRRVMKQAYPNEPEYDPYK